MFENKKYLRYCPNCTNYDSSTGVCTYVNENVMEYPNSFIKYCDGKYLSLIKGRKIEPEIQFDDHEAAPKMVTVFSQNNYSLFHVTKTLLEDNKIKFWSNGAYTGADLLSKKALMIQLSLLSDGYEQFLVVPARGNNFIL